MCGIVGLLLRDPSLEPHLGSMLVPMIEALDERGPDSVGIALYADHPLAMGRSGPPLVQISLGSDSPLDWGEVTEVLSARPGTAVAVAGEPFGPGVVLSLPADAQA